jgi:hypothetical protein
VEITVVELRQYTLRPGKRDVLIGLFDREFVEPQEAVGARLLGQFRDLGDPDRFVWLRGFADMRAHHAALTGFYGGPVWARHRDTANATMLDSDDVLLLRPLTPVRRPGKPAALIAITVAAQDTSARVAGAGGEVLATLRTEHARNTFPALPVREGEDVRVTIAAFGDVREHARYVAESDAFQELRLAPTEKSWLR